MTRRAANGEGGAGPAGRLRAEHAEATRRAVLAAARSLFGRNGYAQTSVDEIADAARVTKGAVYHHFANKQALFRAVYTQTGADAQDRVIQAGGLGAGAGAQPVDQIVAMMSAYLDASLDPEFRRIILIDGPAVVGFDAEAEAAAAQQPGMQALRSFIAASMAHGQLTECGFFPVAHAERLAADFPRATLITVPGAKTWVPVDNPAAVAGAIADFVPAAPVPKG